MKSKTGYPTNDIAPFAIPLDNFKKLERLGLPTALAITFWETLRSPRRFFEKVAQGHGFIAPLLYSWFCYAASHIFQILMTQSMVGQLEELGLTQDISGFLRLLQWVVPFTYPAWMTLLAFFHHLGLRLVGAGDNGFAQTFRVFLYAGALWPVGAVLGLIPIIGSLALMVWWSALLVTGIEEVHRTTRSQALFGLALPGMVLAVVAGFLGAAMIMKLLSNTGMLG